MQTDKTDQNDWADKRFRAIDDSISTLVRQLLLAVTAMVSAAVATQLTLDAINVHGSASFLVECALLAGYGLVAIFFTSAMPIRRAMTEQRRVIAEGQGRLRREATRHRFASQVQDALEMGDHEADALEVVGRALGEIAPRPAELLLADSSRAHIRRASISSAGGEAGCGVETPWKCPAVRRGQTQRFETSDGLACCPKLVSRGPDVSSVCVPVTVLGTPMGVVHMTSSVLEPVTSEDVGRLEMLAQQAGSRIGMLRAMASQELQAATDPLTGAVNRRSLEHQLGLLREGEQHYALVLADLDHFKDLNDTHGHETGDRALRLFVDVLQSAVRGPDTVCRYGGEEFVLVLPGLDREGAVAVVDRVRGALSHSLDGGGVPRFSASFGVADSTQATESDQVIRLADLAMFEAKRAGRNRAVVSEARTTPELQGLPTLRAVQQ